MPVIATADKQCLGIHLPRGAHTYSRPIPQGPELLNTLTTPNRRAAPAACCTADRAHGA
jgi:hypothetical protein